MVHLYATCGRSAGARKVFDAVPDAKVSAWTALLSGYAKSGELGVARELFDEMPERNLVSWSALIAGYVQSGRPGEALVLFREMLVSRIRPIASVLVSVLVAVAELGALLEGRWVHAYLEREAVEWTPNVRTSLVSMYFKCGDVRSAWQLFDRMMERGVDLWNTMITGVGLNGKGTEALALFDEMVFEGIKPDDMTFIGVLGACSHAGLVDEGMKRFESMSKVHDVSPKVEHYSCMVDLLGKAGLLKEALELIESMPMKANSRVWGSLFGACRAHGNTELGEAVGKVLIELEPKHAGHYVLLANLYASSGRWKEAVEVRERMERRGVELEPGCSSIEVEGVVNEFLVGDQSLPMSGDIYDTLDCTSKVGLNGYVEDIRHNC